MGYQRLQCVEQAWRQLESGLRLRPVYHRAAHRIHARIALSVMGLLLERMAEQACGDMWRNIRDDLKQIRLMRLSGPNGRLWQVTEPREGARKRLKGLQIKAPPTLLELAWAPGDVRIGAHLRKGLICLAKSKPCIYRVSKSGVLLLRALLPVQPAGRRFFFGRSR